MLLGLEINSVVHTVSLLTDSSDHLCIFSESSTQNPPEPGLPGSPVGLGIFDAERFHKSVMVDDSASP